MGFILEITSVLTRTATPPGTRPARILSCSSIPDTEKGFYWLDTSFNTCELLSSNHVSWRQRNIGWYRFITSCRKSFLWWLIPSQLYEIILRIPIILTSDISNVIRDPSIMSYLLSFLMLMGRYSHYSDYPFSHKKFCKLHHQAKNRKTLPGPCLYFGQSL